MFVNTSIIINIYICIHILFRPWKARTASVQKLAETPVQEASKRGREVLTPGSAKTPSTKTPDQKRTKPEEPKKVLDFESSTPQKLLPNPRKLDSAETLVLGGCGR